RKCSGPGSGVAQGERAGTRERHLRVVGEVDGFPVDVAADIAAYGVVPGQSVVTVAAVDPQTAHQVFAGEAKEQGRVVIRAHVEAADNVAAGPEETIRPVARQQVRGQGAANHGDEIVSGAHVNRAADVAAKHPERVCSDAHVDVAVHLPVRAIK